MARTRSLRTLLLLSFLPVAIVPIALVGVTVALRHQDEQLTVEQRIQEDLLRGGTQRLALIEAALNNVIDSGRTVVAMWSGEPPDRRNELLTLVARQHSAFLALRVVGPDATVRYASDRRGLGRSLASEPWWPHFKQAVEPQLSDLVRDEQGREVVQIGFAMPRGEVLVATYDATQLQNALTDPIAKQLGRHVLLVDHHGRVVAHTDPGLFGKTVADLPPVQRALSGQLGTMIFRDPAHGQARSAAYLPFGRLGGALVALQPGADSMLTNPSEDQRDTMFFLLAGLVLAVLATAIASRRIARPVESFARQLEGMTDPGPSQSPMTLAPAGIDELERLEHSAERLFSAQHETIAELGARTRELELANQQASSAVEALQQLDRLRANFLNALSHDLRIPLTSIVGYAELLQDQPDAPEQPEYLEQILRASARMEAMLEELLDYVRLEAGRYRLRVEPVDPEPILAETLAFFEPLATQKRQRLTLEVQTGMPPLQVDPDRLRQILNNLVSNAIKYTPADGRIAVRAVRQAEQTVLTVRDDGIGLSEEDRTHLFEKFFRSERAEVKRQRGSGLGLSLVKGYVEAHGGWIEVDAALNLGSEFRVVFPDAPRSESALSAPSAEAAS